MERSSLFKAPLTRADYWTNELLQECLFPIIASYKRPCIFYVGLTIIASISAHLNRGYAAKNNESEQSQIMNDRLCGRSLPINVQSIGSTQGAPIAKNQLSLLMGHYRPVKKEP